MPARKKTTSPAPIILTPEQVEAQARREERNAAYLAAREDLLSRAQAIAEKLHPGRVHLHGVGDCFSVMTRDYPSHLPFPPTTPEMLAALEQLKETVKRADIKILLGKDPLPPPNKESK